VKVLTDHNISPKVARALNALVEDGRGACVVSLREKFAPSAPDVEWIAELGREGGWSVISADLRIYKNRVERAAWMQTDLIGYFLEPGLATLRPVEQAARLLLRLEAIETQSRLIRGPAMFAIPLRNSSALRQVRVV
jgi:hypothetical protein